MPSVRRPLAIALLLAVPLGCAPPRPTTAPEAAKRGAPPPPARAGIDPSTYDDLGPSDREDPPPAEDPQGAEYTFVDAGPERLFGTRGDSRRRPNMPGRSGGLHVAIDTPYQLYGRASTYVHVAAWRKDGTPAASARVFVGRRAVGRTDADGTLVFRYRKPETKDDDDLGMSPIFVIDGGRCGAADFSPYQRTPTFASDQLYVYTDRGVYRPGETVHVRVIGWRLESDYVPITGGDVELVLRDGSGHSIAAATIHTDEFGTGATDLRVPLSADIGDYDLSIAYAGARESTDLQIRRFEAPQIRIDHTLPRHMTTTRETLAFTVSARPTAGGKLGKASIGIEAAVAGGSTVTLDREVTSEGPHAFELSSKQLATLREVGRVDSIRVAITVRDARGREDTTLRYIDVSDNPYVAVLEPDKDAYTTGDEVVVVARVSDVDDVAVRNRSLELLLGDKTRLTAKTDAAGIATFRFAMPAKAQTISLFADDVKSPIATSSLGWSEPFAMTTTLSDPVVREHAMVKLAARFPRGHEPVDRRVHVDIIDTSGAIVGSTILRATKEKGAWVARGEIVAPTWGSSLFTFFALGRGELDARERGGETTTPSKGKPGLGLLVAGQEIAVVPDRELQIELTGLPDRAAPGEALEIGAIVRDRRGRPVDFAASAAIVDSAVLALNDPLEVTPMDRFYDPELRTLGTTGAQMLTWPVVTRNWGEHRWDVALPPFSFLGPGDAESCRTHWDDEDIRAFEAQAGGVAVMGLGAGGGGSGHGTIGLGSVGTVGMGRPGLPTITVRKRFGDTSLWEADLRGRGEAKVQATLPDAIGEQEVVVVASDRRGGVGVARRRVKVEQDLFVEADLPDIAIAGESVEIPIVVHNRGRSAMDVRVALQTRHAQMKLASGDQGSTQLPLGALPSGKHPVIVQATFAGRHIDRVERDVVVSPAGVPTTSMRAATATAHKPARFELTGGEGKQAHLRIEVPAVTTAFLGLDEMLGTIADDPWALAGDLSTAAILLRLADRHAIRSARLDDLRGQIVAAVAMTARVQRHGGGFAYWRNGKPSPYVTAMVLDGLLDAQDAGVRVPSKVVVAAAGFIAERMPDGKLDALHDIGWWEGDDDATKRAIEAEIFAVLARLGEKERSAAVKTVIDAMATRAATTIDETTDVRALANATIGLVRLGKLDGTRVVAVAKRLVDARDHGHWEPTWFSAWGGTIEATSAALEVLALASETQFAIEKRDALRWLLATRASWGTWHNERGTVAALRAIAAVGAPRIDGPTEIVVRADGEVIARARLEPEDPLAGALGLAHVDVPIAGITGKHEIVVETTGALSPSVALVESTWRTGKGPHATGKGIVLESAAAAKLAVGATKTLEIRAKGRRLGGATLRIGRSGLVDLDAGVLADRLGRGGAVADVRVVEDAIEIRLAPTATELELDVPALARRRGSGRWPAIALVPVGKGSAAPIVVDPGALTVE